jgi:hypothetical protein
MAAAQNPPPQSGYPNAGYGNPPNAGYGNPPNAGYGNPVADAPGIPMTNYNNAQVTPGWNPQAPQPYPKQDIA